jgi:Ca2+/H+ antiporter
VTCRRPWLGVVIALLLVLLPEAIAAVRAAARDRVQTSLNLALGSATAGVPVPGREPVTGVPGRGSVIHGGR